MRYAGVIVAGLLLMFGTNAIAFESPEPGFKPVQKKEKDQEKDQKEEESDEDESSESDEEEVKEPEPSAALVAVREMVKEYEEQYNAFMKLTRDPSFMKDYRKAARDGREAAMNFLKKSGQPDRAKYAKDVEEVAALSMAWLAANGTDRAKSTAAMKYLFDNHADSPVIEMVIERAGVSVPSKVAESRYRQVLESNPSEKVKALASLSLAELLARREPEDITEIEELYQTVIDKYAAIESRGDAIGPRAKKALFALKYLRVGAVAPDINGEDIDGVEFKLSDYRGKVVLLDFWGDW